MIKLVITFCQNCTLLITHIIDPFYNVTLRCGQRRRRQGYAILYKIFETRPISYKLLNLYTILIHLLKKKNNHLRYLTFKLCVQATTVMPFNLRCLNVYLINFSQHFRAFLWKVVIISVRLYFFVKNVK